MDGAALLSLDHVSRTYEMGRMAVAALADVSLDVMPGEFVAIVGPSGSGKSTMMNILGCLDRPTSGQYRLAGTPVETLDDDGLAASAQPDHRVRLPVVQPAATDLRARQRRDAAPVPGRLAARARARGPRPRSSGSGSATGSTTSRRSCPAASSSASRSPGRSSRSRRSILADEPTGNLDSHVRRRGPGPPPRAAPVGPDHRAHHPRRGGRRDRRPPDPPARRAGRGMTSASSSVWPSRACARTGCAPR